MMSYLNFMFSDAGHFFGCLALLILWMVGMMFSWNRLLKTVRIIARGYPPDYCNDEGDVLN